MPASVPAEIVAAEAIVQRESARLLAAYGSNTHSPATGGTYLPYHNQTHGLEVCRFAQGLAEQPASRGLLAPRDVAVAMVAGICHDAEQHFGRVENERRSADVAVGALRSSTELCSDRCVQLARAAVLATIPDFSVPGRIGQSVMHSGNDSALDLVQCVVADADLSALGAPNGVEQGLRVLVEARVMDGTVTVDGPAGIAGVQIDREALAAFLAGQVQLYETHRYYLAESTDALAPGRRRNAMLAGELLKRVRRGAGFAEVWAAACEAALPVDG